MHTHPLTLHPHTPTWTLRHAHPEAYLQDATSYATHVTQVFSQEASQLPYMDRLK